MKTLKEFDYDLWAEEKDGQKRYYVRVKSTREVTEVSIEVMRILANDEKKMRKKKKKELSLGKHFSLDYMWENNANEICIGGIYDVVDEVHTEIMKQEFLKLLTNFQKEVYLRCMLGNMRCTEFAREKGIDSSTVYESRDTVRKKIKKFLG